MSRWLGLRHSTVPIGNVIPVNLSVEQPSARISHALRHAMQSFLLALAQEAGQRLESPEQTMHVNDKLRTRTHAGPRAQGPGANKYWHPPSTKRTGFRAQMVHVWLNDGLALACPPPLTLSLALSSDDVVSPCCRIPGSANPQTPNCVNETRAATASQRGPLERPAILY